MDNRQEWRADHFAAGPTSVCKCQLISLKLTPAKIWVGFIEESLRAQYFIFTLLFLQLSCSWRDGSRRYDIAESIAEVDIAEYIEVIDIAEYIAEYIADVDISEYIAEVDIAEQIADVDIEEYIADVDIEEYIADVDIAEHCSILQILQNTMQQILQILPNIADDAVDWLSLIHI